MLGQLLAFGELVALNQYFTGGSVSHTFVYVLTGAHGAHVVSGVAFLLIVMYSAFKLKVHSKNMNQIEMCATYWHFLGILWLYLLLFLMWNK
jgi:cytochrome c oxidase subunit III